jgi:hypothetical protein
MPALNGGSTRTSTREKRLRTQSIDDIEARIGQLEEELKGLSQDLSSPASEWSRDQIAEMGLRHQTVSSELQKLYKEWEDSHGT